MNEQILARFLRDLVNTNTPFPYVKSVSLPQYQNHIFNIRIDAEDIRQLTENQRLHKSINANTVSSLPSGAPCSCCNGSGRST